MNTQSALACIRFGFGVSPVQAGPKTAEDLLAQLDLDRPNLEGPSVAERFSVLNNYRDLRKLDREGMGDDDQIKAAQIAMRTMAQNDLIRSVKRQVVSPLGFVERLTEFWADHFTVSAKTRNLRMALPDYIDRAIRSNLSGRFADMVFATATHPAMLMYLDQGASFGPNSYRGQRRARGLNENYARELLELHTLGVGSGYSQTDVRELANLLTGLHTDGQKFYYDRRRAEPGSETVLGKQYGGQDGNLEDIRAVIDDLATRPETARHIARKLVVHFVNDAGDPDIEAVVAEAFQASRGDLTAAYAALLNHPNAWSPELHKIKPPMSFVVSALRGLNAGATLDVPTVQRDLDLQQPLLSMGQNPFRPAGPDGWSEQGSDWITPTGIAARIAWAQTASEVLGKDRDPREFVQAVLGPLASEALHFAAAGAETRAEGIALVLASPEFNRR